MSDRVAPGGLTALITGKPQTIEVELPDGRVLDVEAGSPEEAGRAAKAFLDREGAQNRLEAEDAQRGPLGRLFKNISDGTTQIAANIPFAGGLVDEGNALVRSGGGLWGDYDQELAYERERQAQAAERSPTATKINSLAGAIGGGGAMLKALPAGATAFIPKTATARILSSGATGAAGGAVEGFTRGEGGLEDRLAEMPWSAALGGFMGGVLPPVAKGIGAGYNAVASWAANRGLDAKSINILLDRLKAQGVTPQQAQARIAELGDEAMLADVTPGMQAFTGGTALADIGAGNTIGQRLAQRREGGGDRVRDVLNDAFGPPADPYTVRQTQRDIRSTTGDVYSKTAGEHAVDMAPVADFVQKEILRVGPRGPHGEVLQRIRSIITDDNGNLVTRGDSVHSIREQLDMMGEEAVARGMPKLAAEISKVRRGVDEALKSGVPGMREADLVNSTSFRNQRAYDEGRTDVLKGGPNTMTPAQLDARMVQSSDPENLFRAQGVRTELDRITGNSRGDPGARVDRVLDRDWNTPKVTSMIGPQKAQDLRRGLDAEATFTETSNLGEPGRQSRTAVINAARDFWGANAKPGAAGDMLAAGAATTAATGSSLAGATAAMGVGANRLRQAVGNALTRKPSPALMQKTAENLTAQGIDLRSIARLLTEKAEELPKRSEAARNLERFARVLLATQAGRAGFEGQRLIAGGPR